MNQISIHLATGKRHFLPGETIEGAASWNLSTPPHAIEIRLLWFTAGKGTTDRQIIDTRPIATTSAIGDSRFSFELPRAPHSFSGQLISLTWAIEVASLKPPAIIRLGSSDQAVERAEFTMGFDGREIELGVVETGSSALEKQMLQRFFKKKSESALRSDSPWSDSKTGK